MTGSTVTVYFPTLPDPVTSRKYVCFMEDGRVRTNLIFPSELKFVFENKPGDPMEVKFVNLAHPSFKMYVTVAARQNGFLVTAKTEVLGRETISYSRVDSEAMTEWIRTVMKRKRPETLVILHQPLYAVKIDSKEVAAFRSSAELANCLYAHEKAINYMLSNKTMNIYSLNVPATHEQPIASKWYFTTDYRYFDNERIKQFEAILGDDKLTHEFTK